MELTVNTAEKIREEAWASAVVATNKYIEKYLDGQDAFACGFAWVTVYPKHKGNTKLGKEERKVLTALGLKKDSIPQIECFAGALQFAKAEGIVPAPEPTHAIAAAVREALACKASGEEKVILTALCGHGHLDLASYDKYLSGDMVDLELSDDVIAEAMQGIPVIG